MDEWEKVKSKNGVLKREFLKLIYRNKVLK